jgi:hypothetical protein
MTQSLGDWTTFFVDSEQVKCPIKTCSLLGAGCSTSYESAYPNG